MALSTKGYVWTSEFARRHRAEGWAEGWLEGLEEGRAEGRQEGRDEGRDEGRRLALLEVLEGRGLTISDAQREAILAPANGAQLAGWIRRAGVVATVAELFDSGDA